MTPNPERRQRILHAHQLHQRGHSLSQIAAQLDVSRATVHADLRLLDEAFPQIIQSVAHDHILERLEYTAQQLRQLADADPFEPLLKYSQLKDDRAAPLVGQVAAPDIVRLHGQHRSAMIALLREHRLAADKLESAALARRESAAPTAYYLDQAAQILDQAEQHLTESEHLAPPRPDSEPAPEPPATQNSAEHPEPPRPDSKPAPEPPTTQNSAEHPEHPEQLEYPEHHDQPDQPTPQPSRAQRRRAEAAQRKARKKNLRKPHATAA